MYEDQGFLAKLYLDYPVYFSSRHWLDYRQHDESCVAEVHRAGRYDDVRRYFLEWFRSYLGRRPAPDPGVLRAVERALWWARHPRLKALEARLRKGLDWLSSRRQPWRRPIEQGDSRSP
jgi:hypothetical protein